MNRRQFLKRAGLGAAAIASVPTLGPTLLDALAGTAFASDQTNFDFVVVSRLTEGPDLLILNGSGRFNNSGVKGGGSFTIFNPETGEVDESGTWLARRLRSFTSAGTFGAHAAGVLEMEIRLLPERLEGAALKVVCNLPGADTGQEEGVTAFDPDGSVFAEPTGTGVTVFSTGNENRG